MTARLLLFIVWFSGYTISFLLLLTFAAKGYTVPESVFGNLAQLTGVFAPYIGPVVAYWFAEDVIGQKRPHHRLAFVVALMCSIFFNLAVLVILASVFFRAEGQGVIEQTLELVTNVGTLLAFLVGPAIGFFFAKANDVKNLMVPESQPRDAT